MIQAKERVQISLKYQIYSINNDRKSNNYDEIFDYFRFVCIESSFKYWL